MVKDGIFGNRYEVLIEDWRRWNGRCLQGKRHHVESLCGDQSIKKEYREDENFVRKFHSKHRQQQGF